MPDPSETPSSQPSRSSDEGLISSVITKLLIEANEAAAERLRQDAETNVVLISAKRMVIGRDDATSTIRYPNQKMFETLVDGVEYLAEIADKVAAIETKLSGLRTAGIQSEEISKIESQRWGIIGKIIPGLPPEFVIEKLCPVGGNLRELSLQLRAIPPSITPDNGGPTFTIPHASLQALAGATMLLEQIRKTHNSIPEAQDLENTLSAAAQDLERTLFAALRVGADVTADAKKFSAFNLYVNPDLGIVPSTDPYAQLASVAGVSLARNLPLSVQLNIPIETALKLAPHLALSTTNLCVEHGLGDVIAFLSTGVRDENNRLELVAPPRLRAQRPDEWESALEKYAAFLRSTSIGRLLDDTPSYQQAIWRVVGHLKPDCSVSDLIKGIAVHGSNIELSVSEISSQLLFDTGVSAQQINSMSLASVTPIDFRQISAVDLEWEATKAICEDLKCDSWKEPAVSAMLKCWRGEYERIAARVSQVPS